MAKKFHPDVNTTGETHFPNAEKFREIAEAYAVLSVPESRTVYDLTSNKKPDSVFKAQRDEVMEERRSMRDATGHVPAPKPLRGSYAEKRLKELADARALHNVNHLGYYKGGLPQKG